MTATGHVLIDQYLRELRNALGGMPPQRRDEIVAEISEHIAGRLAELSTAPNDADIRNILEQVGEPKEIAAEVREPLSVPPSQRRFTDILAVVLLPIPFVGWIVGGVLLWLSEVWSTRDKLIGTLAGPGMLVFLLLLTIAIPAGASGGEEMTTEPQPVGVQEGGFGLGPVESLVIFLGLFLGPLVAAVYLGQKLRGPRAEAI